jgi:hypothetical protein
MFGRFVFAFASAASDGRFVLFRVFAFRDILGMLKKKKGKGSRGAADVTRIGKADCAFRRDAGRTILGAMSEASVMVFSGGGPACEWRSRDAIGVSR